MITWFIKGIFGLVRNHNSHAQSTSYNFWFKKKNQYMYIGKLYIYLYPHNLYFMFYFYRFCFQQKNGGQTFKSIYLKTLKTELIGFLPECFDYILYCCIFFPIRWKSLELPQSVWIQLIWQKTNPSSLFWIVVFP